MSDKFTIGHASGVSSTCGRCGGLIMDANTCYGYAGKVCQCNWMIEGQPPFTHIPPQYQPSHQTDRELLNEIRDLLQKLLEKSK